MISEPISLDDGIKELRALAQSFSDSASRDRASDLSEELVKVFLDTCLLARKSNNQIVEMVRSSSTASTNAAKILQSLLEQSSKTETKLNEMFCLLSLLCFYLISLQFISRFHWKLLAS